MHLMVINLCKVILCINIQSFPRNWDGGRTRLSQGSRRPVSSSLNRVGLANARAHNVQHQRLTLSSGALATLAVKELFTNFVGYKIL